MSEKTQSAEKARLTRDERRRLAATWETHSKGNLNDWMQVVQDIIDQRFGARADGEYEFIQCPHEAIRATCVGLCNCPCGPCAPSRISPGQADQ